MIPSHHKPFHKRSRPTFVKRPSSGIAPKIPLRIVTPHMRSDKAPNVTIDCAACQRTLRFFFSRKKRITPDTQPSEYDSTRSTRSSSPSVVILCIITSLTFLGQLDLHVEVLCLLLNYHLYG